MKEIELKTWKDLETNEIDFLYGVGVPTEIAKKEAINWIQANQTGKGVSRDIIPITMRGKLAKKHWNDSKFTLGFEYGAIAMLMKFFDIREELK